MSLENPALSPRLVRPARKKQQLCSCCGRTTVWNGAVRLLAPLEDQLAEGEVQIDEEEAANLCHVNPPPQQPSSEVEKHRVEHYPYRT